MIASRTWSWIAVALTLPVFSSAHAADAAKGKALHDSTCVSCHVRMTGGDGSVLYTRPDRKVTSFDKLESQVRRCDANLQTRWFDDDIHNVVEYLNQAYYKFPKK